MPVFRPCIGTRAQIDATLVVNGQFLIASDTGESFLDVNGRRVQLSGGTSSGGGSADDDDVDSLFTFWPTVNAAVCMSESVSGGGPGSGILNVPTVLLEMMDENLVTDQAVISPLISTSESVSGGGPGAGLTNMPAILLETIEDDLATCYSIMEA